MFQLEKVLGTTVNDNGSLASNQKNIIAYPAGSTIVLQNIKNNSTQYVINTSKRAIKSLVFSNCGKYLIYSEHGQSSAIKIWLVEEEIKQITEILPEDNGTRCLNISPDDKYIVSVGSNLTLSLWDWKSKIRVTANKINSDIKGISFAEDGKYFVTAGKKHLKYWYLENGTLNGKSASLSELSDIYFIDVSCGKRQCNKFTYAVTKMGNLCVFNEKRLLEMWIELRIPIYCLIVSQKYVLIGCAEGVINCFDNATLEFMFSLPKCHSLGADKNSSYLDLDIENAKYPDIIAMTFSETNNTIACIYNDRSLYTWDLNNPNDITRINSSLHHSNCIWDIKMTVIANKEYFVTCSSDNTIRLWSTEAINLEKVIYVNKNIKDLKDVNRNREEACYGVRCISISADVKELASGDRQGCIRIYKFPNMEKHLEIKDHDMEILSLDYTPLESKYRFLASSGKDKEIHIFDVSDNYMVIQKISDHVASVATVKFVVTKEGNLKIISASNDGNCIIRSLDKRPNAIQFIPDHHINIKTILYDFELDISGKYLFIASNNLKIFDLDSRKIIKRLKASQRESHVFKISLDSSNKYIAASYLDKSIVVYDFSSGNPLATLYSNLVTNLSFTQDRNRLIAATGDGCIFVWKYDIENSLLEDDDELLPTWAKKLSDVSANIELSSKSLQPKGKWAQRFERNIIIRSSHPSDESDLSPRSFESDSMHSDDIELKIKDDSHLKPTFLVKKPTLRLPKSPRIPVDNLKKMSIYSFSSDALHTKNLKTNEFESDVKDKKEVKSNKLFVSNVDSKIPRTKIGKSTASPGTTRRLNLSENKREKATQIIGQVKEKLDNIQLKSSKSMGNLTQIPTTKDSWLLKYRTSVENPSNQLRKQGSLGNLTMNKQLNEKNNQSDSDADTRFRSKLPKAVNSPVKRKIKNSSNNSSKGTVRTEFDSSLNLNTTEENKSKLNTVSRSALIRARTESEINIKKLPKHQLALPFLDKQLSTSRQELNATDYCNDIDLSTVKITEQLCEDVASELVATATKATQLYKRYLYRDEDSSGVYSIENLELALVWAQIKLLKLSIDNK